MSDITTKTIYVGIDLSFRSNQVAVIDNEGKKLASLVVGNDLPGAKKLVEKIIVLGKDQGATDVKIGMEATGLYWWHIYQYLNSDSKLNQEFNLEVYTINPKIIKRFHDSLNDADKSDPIDALAIADRLRFGKLNKTHLIDEQYEPLKRLTRYRYHLVKSIRIEKNYFLTHLFLKYSSWQKLTPFNSVFSVTAEEVISEFDPEDLAVASLDTIVSKISAASGNRLPDPKKAALLLTQVVNTSYQLDKRFKEPIDLILTNTYENIRYFESKVKTIDEVIAREFGRFPNPLMSIKGIGLVFAAGITSELGSVTRFTKQSAIGKYAGLAWKKSQSGGFEAEETPRKPGNTYLRYYLVQAANSLRVHDESYRQYYERKAGEVPKHQHKRALVLTARKLARLCFAMLRDQRLYQPELSERRKT